MIFSTAIPSVESINSSLNKSFVNPIPDHKSVIDLSKILSSYNGLSILIWHSIE